MLNLKLRNMKANYKPSRTALAVTLLSLGQLCLADDLDWTDDFTKCNAYRAVDQDCPDDRTSDGKRFTMIPATQRTDNTAGYALDVTPWTTDNQFWIKMEAYTPVLPLNSIFEMYTSILDTYDTDVTMYDTVKCSLEFWGKDAEVTYESYSINDYRSDKVFYKDETEGDFESSVAQYLDTASGGTEDWNLSRYEGDNVMECNDYYCKFTCVVYRKQITDDKDNDVQF